MGHYFQAGLYTQNELGWLAKQKRELALKHHPDKGGMSGSFIAMMKEYEAIKQAIETVGHFEQQQPKRDKKGNLCFYSGEETIEEAIQFQKEHLEKMRQEEHSKKHPLGGIMDFIISILSIPKIQTMLLAMTFPLIFLFGLPFGIEGILFLFGIHIFTACLLGKRTFAFVSLVVFSLVVKNYEPLISTGLWDTVGNTVNFWLAVIIILSIAKVEPRAGSLGWSGLWHSSKSAL